MACILINKSQVKELSRVFVLLTVFKNWVPLLRVEVKLATLGKAADLAIDMFREDGDRPDECIL